MSRSNHSRDLTPEKGRAGVTPKLGADYRPVQQKPSIQNPKFTRIRKAFGILFLVIGVGMCAGDALFVGYMRRAGPASPEASAVGVQPEGDGSPHFLVTRDGYLVMGILFGTGVIVAGFGGRLWKESLRLK
jgi:hypothetical protein